MWPLLAAVGVVLLTEPWHGDVDLVGVLLALAAAVCWGSYILLTQHVGDEVTGLGGLAVSLPVAGLVATLVAGPSTLPHLTWQIVVVGIGLALLLPVVPFSLELLALRRLTTSAFGTLMSLEPGDRAGDRAGAAAPGSRLRPGVRRRLRRGGRDRRGAHRRPSYTAGSRSRADVSTGGS